MRRYQQFDALIQAWNRGDIDAVLDCMSEDAEWHVAAGAFAPLAGKVAIRDFLETLRSGMAETRWRILCHAETEDRLFVEGVDGFTLTSGLDVAAPYAAVVEFRGDHIVAWRDYIDTRRMESLRSGAPVPGHVAALVQR